uniref:Germin-like protein n=1 Tax=Quercus lobata TaxID=97700 RepID=A0A7N2LTE3_QUELO
MYSPSFIFIAALASDPSPLQDFCVADTNSQVLLNGLACKDPKIVEANDFSSSELHIAGNTSNPVGVLEGSLEVGFVTSNPQNRLITKVLQKGDVFVFPIGLIHYQRNVGNGSVIAIAALSSQNPGVITIANAVFGSKPQIPSDILVKAFQVDKDVVNYIQSKF